MMFAITHGRARPGPGNVVDGPAGLAARLAALSGSRLVRLWETYASGEDELSFTPVAEFKGYDAGELAPLVRGAALRRAETLYTHGDCWVLAHVAAKALDRPVTAFVAPGIGVPGEPDHLVVDLGEGLYLDARGVLDATGMARGLQPGSKPEFSLDADAVPALFDRFYAIPGYGFADKLSGGFGDSTRVLFETFLEAGAREAMPGQGVIPVNAR